jgi:hypothetical protein
MINYGFYNCLRRTTIMFLDMFNDIKINRYDVNGVVKGQYLVPIRYGPKSKAYLWVKDHGRDEEMLPMLSVYITSIDFDPNRLTNKYQDILVSTDNQTMKGVFAKNAIPYNIGFTLNIWALHMVDIDQIMEQILPYFQPHAFIRVRIPEIDVIFDVKVICNGCSPVMTDDVGEEEARVVKWDINFTTQTWLIKPSTEEKPLIGNTTIGGSISGSSSIGGWVAGKTYHVDDIIYSNGKFYSCILDHVSIQETIPDTGMSWSTYWKYMANFSGYGWTSGYGTSGYGDSGTSGKIVQRYYMDMDAFVNRDNPTNEVYSDPRPSEVVAFRIVDIDDEAKIIIDYELFNNGGEI